MRHNSTATLRVAGLPEVLVDPRSGARHEIVAPRLYVPRDKGFAKVFKLFAGSLLYDLCSMNAEAPVLLWLLAKSVDAKIDGGGWITVDQATVLRETGLSLRSLRRGLARLRDGFPRGGQRPHRYIEQQAPRSNVWRIRPDMVFVGTLKKYEDDQVRARTTTLRVLQGPQPKVAEA
jgi:hypothetical protein